MKLTEFNSIDVRKRCLLLLLGGRMSALIGLFLTAYGVLNFTKIPPEQISIIGLIFVSFISLIQFFLLIKAQNVQRLGLFQLSVDVVLLTLCLEVAELHIAFGVYLLLISTASLVLRPPQVLMLSAVSGVCYGLLVYGIIGIRDGYFQAASQIDVLLGYVSLVVTAALATAYAQFIKHLTSSVHSKDEKIQEITDRQMELMNSLTEGVIILDLNEAVTGINQAARSLLGISEEYDSDLFGKRLKEAVPALGKDDFLSSLSDGQGTEVAFGEGEAKTTVRCTLQHLAVGSENETQILFMSDVGELRDIETRLEFHERMQQLVNDIELAKPQASTIDSLIGSSDEISKLSELILRVAPSDAPVLIEGESGTGKEVVARAIHDHSERKLGPFVAVNCGAIPETLIESELFGYKKGAFTGAERDTLGLFREANGGTLLLDEVGELPQHLQAKLLRVLQEKSVRPVGASKEVPIDVRIIAATHKDLKAESQVGNFREDLFYRLRVIELSIPALRERREDIPVLIAHFLQKEGVDAGSLRIPANVMSVLMSYDYPGNVRELENIVARAHVLGAGEIILDHLPREVVECKKVDGLGEQVVFPVDLEGLLANVEQDYIRRALIQAGGIKKKAAELLGINFRSFRYRLKKYGMDEEKWESSSSESGPQNSMTM